MTSLLDTDGRRLLEAVRAILARKGLASADEIEERIEITDRASPALGASMVAKAWLEPEYRALMVEDGTRAAEAMGIPMRGLPPLGVLESTAAVHHLVVCTLCSCYPRAVLGYPPYWFKSASFRSRPSETPAGSWPNGARRCRRRRASASSIRRQTTAGWCCHAAHRGPRDGTPCNSRPSCMKAI